MAFQSSNSRGTTHPSTTWWVESQLEMLIPGFSQAAWAKASLNPDDNQINEAFINGGRGHPPSHLKFFLLVFSKLIEDIK